VGLFYRRLQGTIFRKISKWQHRGSKLIPHRRIVDRFVATIEKGKSVGRAPVNEEIVEDLLQWMEQSSKKSLTKLSLQADVPLEKPELLFTQNTTLELNNLIF
jgi:hypothetical protein